MPFIAWFCSDERNDDELKKTGHSSTAVNVMATVDATRLTLLKNESTSLNMQQNLLFISVLSVISSPLLFSPLTVLFAVSVVDVVNVQCSKNTTCTSIIKWLSAVYRCVSCQLHFSAAIPNHQCSIHYLLPCAFSFNTVAILTWCKTFFR